MRASRAASAIAAVAGFSASSEMSAPAEPETPSTRPATEGSAAISSLSRDSVPERSVVNSAVPRIAMPRAEPTWRAVDCVEEP